MAIAGVVGTGLIGTSIALGLREAGWEVVGWDRDPAALGGAAARGALRPMATMAAIVEGDGDLLVLAVPAGDVTAVLSSLSGERLITDVAGVKRSVVAAGSHLPGLVPSHPMAGREVSGPDAASGSLFRGAAWVLVTDAATEANLARMETIVAALGARPVRMTAAAHDDAVAVISHLPQVLASALVREAAASTDALDLAAGSFRDLTRVAASDPAAWSELLVANRPSVVATLGRFGSRLSAWADAIDTADVDALEAALSGARDIRDGLGPPVVPVRVALADRPGELARVGRALAESRVDVRDLQLRHAPYGGGGVLTIFVRPGDAAPLEGSLRGEDLLLIST